MLCLHAWYVCELWLILHYAGGLLHLWCGTCVCVYVSVCGYYLALVLWFSQVPVEHGLRKRSVQMAKRVQSQGPL